MSGQVIETGAWQVLRWSGHMSQEWTVKYSGPSEELAVKVFERLAAQLRSGFVRLVDPRGKVVTEPKRIIQDLVKERA